MMTMVHFEVRLISVENPEWSCSVSQNPPFGTGVAPRDDDNDNVDEEAQRQFRQLLEGELLDIWWKLYGDK
jgi:hypothetical protein